MPREITNTQTAPDGPVTSGAAATEPTEWGFVILSSPDEPEFVGAWLPAGAPGDDRILGRGHARPTDPLPRVGAVQQRPGRNQPLGPLANPKISRVQLEIRTHGDGGVAVKNVGSTSLLVNGASCVEARPSAGALLEVGSSLMLLCARRQRLLPETGVTVRHEFGTPDASGMVGEAPSAWELRREIEIVGRHAGHVLVRGPTGAGKELVVRALAALTSPKGPIVERNAATLPEGLIDAELFGNLKNYPNPGVAERVGLIGAADGGVLFLDEFAELPPSAQTHLLRVLDAGQYQRLGEATARNVKFRLLAATNRPLSALRDDIAARFSFHLEVPPLAAHAEDIPLILRHVASSAIRENPSIGERFLDSSGRPQFSHEFLRRVMMRPLAANVRELRQLTLLSLTKSKGTTLDWVEPQSSDGPEPSAPDDESALIQRTLDENNGSIEKTWRALGLGSRFALMRRLKKHKLVVRKKAE